ncbi:hypothetical protein LIER_38616 [Lithospermum erythrorhizon]|uniref:Uncharacterized protein n=1 Tax=Lithospermum erythrorhizon TaxID=34254 RepID=A0AAV3Q6P8_LITER
MLVDTGSSADVLNLSTYDKLRLPRNMLQQMHTPLIVIDIQDSTYNGLIERPILTALTEIVSPLHLKMKFPTTRGIGEICGNQKKARMCYQTSVPPLGKEKEKSKKRIRENHPEVMSMRGENYKENDNSPKERENLKRLVPHEEIVKVPFAEKEPKKTF